MAGAVVPDGFKLVASENFKKKIRRARTLILNIL
jgi:hypothetical protein